MIRRDRVVLRWLEKIEKWIFTNLTYLVGIQFSFKNSLEILKSHIMTQRNLRNEESKIFTKIGNMVTRVKRFFTQRMIHEQEASCAALKPLWRASKVGHDGFWEKVTCGDTHFRSTGEHRKPKNRVFSRAIPFIHAEVFQGESNEILLETWKAF